MNKHQGYWIVKLYAWLWQGECSLQREFSPAAAQKPLMRRDAI